MTEFFFEITALLSCEQGGSSYWGRLKTFLHSAIENFHSL